MVIDFVSVFLLSCSALSARCKLQPSNLVATAIRPDRIEIPTNPDKGRCNHEGNVPKNGTRIIDKHIGPPLDEVGKLALLLYFFYFLYDGCGDYFIMGGMFILAFTDDSNHDTSD